MARTMATIARLVAPCAMMISCGQSVAEEEEPASLEAAGLDRSDAWLAVSPDHRQFVRGGGSWVRLRGVNYNLVQHDAKLAPRAAHMRKIASWGFNLVRFPIAWQFLEPRSGEIDFAYVDEIESAVRLARDEGIYVIIDMAQWNTSSCFVDDFGNGFPGWFVVDLAGDCASQGAFWAAFWNDPTLRSRGHVGERAWSALGDAWRHVAWRLRNYDNVAGWDVLNEPHRGDVLSIADFNGRVLPAFFEDVSAMIRLSDARDRDGRHHVLFVEGEDGDIKDALARPNLDNFALSPHFYADPARWRDCGALSTGLHKGLDRAAVWGVPALFGEIGAAAGPSGGAGPAYARHVSRILGVHGQSWAWWSFHPGLLGELTLDHFELVDNRLREKPAVAALRDNLDVYGGRECP